LVVNSGDGLFGVEDGGEIEWDSDVFADIFKEKFWFGKVKILGVDEFRVRIRNSGARAHFEEAVEDDEE
jgi:hypothetical protein